MLPTCPACPAVNNQTTALAPVASDAVDAYFATRTDTRVPLLELDVSNEAAHQAEQLARWQTKDAMTKVDYDDDDLDELSEEDPAWTDAYHLALARPPAARAGAIWGRAMKFE